MLQSHVVEIAGVFAGAAIASAGRFRFVAVDPRVRRLDGTEYMSLDALGRAARRLLVTQSDRAASDRDSAA